MVGRITMAIILPALISLWCGCSLQSVATSSEPGLHRLACAEAQHATQVIYVVNLGWHSGVVINGDTIREHATTLAFISRGRWTEFGWGDSDFYRSSGYSWWRGLQALTASRATALHAASFEEAPERFFAEAEVFQVAVSEIAVKSLVDYVEQSLDVADGDADRLGPSLYGTGGFYAAKGRFSIVNTCNTWTAGALIAAGCAVEKNLSRAGTLSRALKRLERDNKQ